jgi:hypothetical protein
MMARILRFVLLGLQDLVQNFGIYVIIMLFTAAGVISYDIGKVISITHGLASFVGTFLFWIAGSGFRASLIRNKNVKGEQGQNLMVARFAVSIGFIIGGYFLLTYSQVQPNIFGISFSPISWGILAIVIGFIFVKKEQAL